VHPSIIFLHGFMGSGADWDELATRLDQFSCQAIDLPGHGSCNVEVNSFDACGDYVLEQLPAEPCVLVGYSMGGRLALSLALQSPQRFSMLVLESASPGLKTELERAARRDHDEQLAHELETRNFDAFLDDWYQQPVFASLQSAPEKLAALKQRRLQNRPQNLARTLRACSVGGQPSYWGELSQLAVPLRVVAGVDDPKYVAIAQEIAGTTPNADVAIVRHSGHTTHFENPEAFATQLTNWIDYGH
jgi:2-succinyl-6-hydroxy-2,4-cyclohexadiene-1-carboxylate synthase